MNPFKGIFISVIAILLSATSLPAQEVRAIIKLGDSFFDNEDYFRATNYYLKALEKEPRNTIAKYRLAESYRLITNYQDAERFYAEVLQRSESSFPLARYYYALTQKFNGKYNEALGNFEMFLKNIDAKKYSRLRGNMVITFSEQARIELEGCLLALEELSKNRVNHNFHLLQQPVNTVFNDYAAYPYHHDSTIVLTSARAESRGSHFDNRFGESLTDLFRFQFEDGQWNQISEVDRFDKEMNSKFHDGSGIFNKDFTNFYFTHCASDTGCEIYFSQFKEEKWTTPTPLNTYINKPGSDSMHPALTMNGDTLFFASDRPGGLGGFDIWMSVRNRTNNWGPAKNLGDYINTAFREISPFYDVIGNTLFFSSDGHLGHGGLDIIMAEDIFDNSSEVFNMGIPYNSSGDDAFFVLGESGGFLSSNRKGGIGNFDIYAFQIDSDIQIIDEIISSNQLASRNSIFVTDYTFDNPDIKMIEGVVSNLMASRLHNTKLPFSTEQQAFYSGLSEADKIRVERIINSRMKSTGFADIQAIRHEDEFFYQQIAGDFRYYVDRMVTYYMEDYDLGAIVQIPDEDKAFYEDLNSNSKSSIDRFIAFKLNEYQEIDLNDEYYLSSPAETRQNIDNISKNYLTAKTSLSDLDLSEVEMDFLNDLDEDEMERVELSIANQVAVLSSKDEYQLNSNDRSFYQGLSELEKSSLDNIAQAYIEASVDDLDQHLDEENLNFYNRLKPKQKEIFDKLLAKRIQNFIKADKYTLDALSEDDIDKIVSLNISDANLDLVAHDSTYLDNELLQEMAKEDQRRFSRLLASAANLIMVNSPSPLKAAALEADKKRKITDLLTKSDLKELPVFSQEQRSFYGNLAPPYQSVFNQVVSEKISQVLKFNELDSLSDSAPMKIQDEMLSGFSPANLSVSDPRLRIINQLNSDDQQSFSLLLIDAVNHFLKEEKDELKEISRSTEISTNTLSVMKSPPKKGDDPDNITSGITVNETTESSNEVVDPINSIDNSSLSTNRNIESEVSTLVNNSKRQLKESLDGVEFEFFTKLNPMDKRFIDQAINKRLVEFVKSNSPVISASSMTSETRKENLSSDFDLAKFNSDPSLRRSISSVIRKPLNERKEIENLMVSMTNLIIEGNQSQLESLTGSKDELTHSNSNIKTTNISTGESSDIPTVEENKERLALSGIALEIQKIITDAKPNFVKSFETEEMQDYMSLSQAQKVFLEEVINTNIQKYIEDEDAILALQQVDDPNLKLQIEDRLKEDTDLFTIIKDVDNSPFANLSSEGIAGLSSLLFKMNGLVINDNSEQFIGMTSSGSVKIPENTSVVNSINQDEITDLLESEQLAAFKSLSSEEQELFIDLINKINNKNRIESNPFQSPAIGTISRLEITEGKWDGQVITIEVLETDKLRASDFPQDHINVKVAGDFQSGQTLKLIWSESTKTWFEIVENPEK